MITKFNSIVNSRMASSFCKPTTSLSDQGFLELEQVCRTILEGAIQEARGRPSRSIRPRDILESASRYGKQLNEGLEE